MESDTGGDRRSPLRSIEPFVFGVEGRDRDIDDFQFSDRPVANIGGDENGSHRTDGDEFAIEFHMSLTFEDEIDLGEFFVVMSFCVGGDIDEMDGGGFVFRNCEGTAGGAAWALLGFEFVEVGNDGFLHVN